MRWGAALLCLAACGGETGVAIELHAPPGVVAIEVFVGDARCFDYPTNTPCDERGVAWHAGQPTPPGRTFVTLRELDDGQDEARHLALQVGDHFELHLQSSSAHNEPEVLAFVGLDANDTAVAVARLDRVPIPTTRGEKWIVRLAPADHAVAVPSGPPPAGEQPWRATVWGRDGATRDDAARCVVVQEWDKSRNEWRADFIVPDNDRDCDGYRPGDGLECDPYYYQLNADGANRTSLCVEQHPTASGEGPCVIGTSPCADGISSDPTCTVPDPLAERAAAICVPDAVCDACSGPYGLEACLAGSVGPVSNISHVHCKLFADATTGAACGSGRPGYVTDIDLGAAGYRCPFVDVRLGSAPLMPLTSLMFPLDQANMSLQYSGQTTSCYIPLFFKDGFAEIGSEHWIVLGLRPYADLSLASTLLVPVRIEFAGANCADTPPETVRCDIVGLAEDQIRQCIPPP